MGNEWKWAGAKWWKFDFHCHTPASKDYGKGTNQDQLKEISPKEWLLAHMRKGIDCVAITDHNSGGWVDQLKAALEELQLENHTEYRPIYLFPGVEISVNGNIHLLAIFSPEKSTSDIDSVLGAVKYRGTKGDCDACSDCSAIEVIEKIIDAGGIAIPAHVDAPRGLFQETSGNTLKPILSSEHVFAMEILDVSYIKPELYESQKIDWTEVLGSDSHHPDDTSGTQYPGSHFTWVKMAEPSFDGLWLALHDGQFAVKRSGIYESDNPNKYGQYSIERMEIKNARYIGRGTLFVCEMNPWLNTIIGGRGTGKSTLLEFLRLAMKRENEIPKNLEQEFHKYREKYSSRQDDGLLTDDTEISLYYRKDGGQFRVRWTSAAHFFEKETNSNWESADGEIAQRLPIRIYSQKQIFEIAKNPQALLEIIDETPVVNYRNWSIKWEGLKQQYMSLRAQAKEIQIALQEESRMRGELDDIQLKIEAFANTGYAEILKTYQFRKDQETAIEDWEKSWGVIADHINEFTTQLDSSLPNLPLFSFDESNYKESDERELHTALSGFQDQFTSLVGEFHTIHNKLTELQRMWHNKKSSLTIVQRISEASQQYEELCKKMETVGVGDPSNYEKIIARKQELESNIKSLAEKRKNHEDLCHQADSCLDEIAALRKKITLSRQEFLQTTLADNKYVRIAVVPYADKHNVEKEFRESIGIETGFERDIETILHYLEDASSLEQSIEHIKCTLRGIRNGDESFISTVNDRRFTTKIQALPPENIDKINCWFPEDSLDIQYQLPNSRKFIPVEQGSPGQKTAAMLAFMLSYGEEPLILDQPEDDLENQLIYDLIVTQLKKIKQNRQVLIVTHNANIVVNGDAENIIALSVRCGRTIPLQGSLQDFDIRQEICRVLEGGTEAFDSRYKRISVARKLVKE